MFTSRVFFRQFLLEVFIFCALFSRVVSAISARMDDNLCQCGEFPLGDKTPLVAIWNAPTGGCSVNFSVHIDLKQFNIEPNPKQRWNGEAITVFYNAQLGLYPYFIDEQGEKNYNGGLPQKIDLEVHLRKASHDIIRKIPDADFSGLAMIDWEGWRPLWDRNFDSKVIYKTKSIQLLRSHHPDWPMNKLIDQAKKDFENAARQMMEATIKLGKELRPKGLWGFYGFPDCYGKQEWDYQCSAETRTVNDELEWLFASSTALYPSIYMYKPRPVNRAIAHGRLAEAFRIVMKLKQKTSKYIPVFPYFRHIYEGNPLEYQLLSDEDLDNTIGQAAEMGCSGVVMWGNRRDENTSPEICHKLNDYIKTKLGPYFKSLKHASEVCSMRKCNGRGRCVSKQSLNKNDYSSNSPLENSCSGPMRNLTGYISSKPSENKNKTILSSDNDIESDSSSKMNGIAAEFSFTDVSMNHSPAFISEMKERNEIEGITTFNSDLVENSLTKPTKESIMETGQMDEGMTLAGIHYTDQYNTNRSSSTGYMSVEDTQKASSQIAMEYCNRTAKGSSKCVVIKPGHHVSTATKLGLGRRVPKTYIFIFCGSAVGALVISALYIVVYYYARVQKRSGEKPACEKNVEDSNPRYQSLPICIQPEPKKFDYINVSLNATK